MSWRALDGAFMVLLMLLVLGPIALSQDKPRKIKVLGTGYDRGMPIMSSWFRTEPSTSSLTIPTRIWSAGPLRDKDIKRFMRLYFPRNYAELLTYEFFLLESIDLAFFTAQQQRWLYDALTENERGAANTRSIMSVSAQFHEPWRDSILSSAFPNDVAAVVSEKDKEAPWGPLLVENGADLPNIIKPFRDEIERIFTIYNGLKTAPKPGSTVLSYTKNKEGTGVPIPDQTAHVFYWSWNQSITFTFQDNVWSDFWSGESGTRTNPYGLDIIIGIVWFSTGRDLPQDPYKVHEYRYRTYTYFLQRNLLISVLDFAESFGANPSGIYVRLQEIDQTVGDSRELYLDRDFTSAYDALGHAADRLEPLDIQAMRLKNDALLWVYAIEWLVITAVFMLVGWIVWWTMIERSLYRAVSATRFPDQGQRE